MAPPDESFYIGDMVMISDMPEDSGLNGVMGTLVKPVGKGRWSLKLEGEDKSKVVPTPNLRKVNMKGHVGLNPAGGGDRAPDKYSIVGTWDDWEPQDMVWSPSSQCFEFTTTIGSDGSESFKILRNGDWDGCVYPDLKDASPYDDHKLLGPDDGGLNEEWTIGVHQNDKASSGMRFKVKLHVLANGAPTRVDWEQEREQAQKPVEEPRFEAAEVQRSRPRMSFAAEVEKKQMATEQNLFDGFGGGGGGQERQYQPKSWEQLKAQEDVEEVERKARERLMARFAAAAEAEPLAIEDEGGKETWAEEVADRQRIERLHQVEANKERYRRSIAEASRKPGVPTAEEVAARLQSTGHLPALSDKMSKTFNDTLEKIQKGENIVIPNQLPADLRIYLRMMKSQMNTGERQEGGGQEPVTNGKTMRRAAAARKKAEEEAEAKALALQKQEENDPYWDELPLPK